MRLLTPPRLLQAVFALALLSGATAHAQIGIAVAKDDDESSIAYRYVYGNFSSSSQAESEARRQLKRRGYDEVSTLTGGRAAGHDLKSAVFVIVKTSYRNYAGRTRISYGLGASDRSYAEAEARALKNLATYDWTWSRRKHGYDVIEKGRY